LLRVALTVFRDTVFVSFKREVGCFGEHKQKYNNINKATSPSPQCTLAHTRTDSLVTTQNAIHLYHEPLVDNLVLIGVSHRRGGATALETWRSCFADILTHDPLTHDPPEATARQPVADVAVSGSVVGESVVGESVVGVHGANSAHAGVKVDRKRHPLNASRSARDWRSLGFVECMPIITCNRFDVLVVLPDGMSVAEAKSRLTPPGQNLKPYAYRGDGALEQLVRITASLDSLNPGEDQITAQVRQSYHAAKARGSVGKTISFAVHSALRIAKRVRREVALAPLNTSLFSLAVPLIARELPMSGRVVVLGSGEMGTLAAKTLANQAGVQLTLVNRTVAKAATLANEVRQYALAKAQTVDVNACSLEHFLAAPQNCDVLVSATPVAGLVDETVLNQLPDVRVIVDLGIPRNVSAGATRLAQQRGVSVLDVDTLQDAGQERRAKLLVRLGEAEAIILSEVDAAVEEWTERQLGVSITRLRQTYLETIGEMLPEDAASELAHKFAHIPIKGLRAVARNHGLDAARTFLKEVGLL
jgi:glutamyl-tRNA reductase